MACTPRQNRDTQQSRASAFRPCSLITYRLRPYWRNAATVCEHGSKGNIRDIWFNGLPQLPELSSSSFRSVAEGERLVDLLSGQTGGSPLPWNERFGRAAAMTKGDGLYVEVVYPDGPTLTLLSPTPRRLESLRRVWTNELLRLQRGEPSEPPTAAIPLPLDNLE